MKRPGNENYKWEQRPYVQTCTMRNDDEDDDDDNDDEL